MKLVKNGRLCAPVAVKLLMCFFPKNYSILLTLLYNKLYQLMQFFSLTKRQRSLIHFLCHMTKDFSFWARLVKKNKEKILKYHTILNSHPLTTRIIVAFLCMPIYLCCCLFTVTLQNINLLYTLCSVAVTLLALH